MLISGIGTPALDLPELFWFGVVLSAVFVQSCLQFYDLLEHAQHINVLFTMLIFFGVIGIGQWLVDMKSVA
jgi:hypothetical protein